MREDIELTAFTRGEVSPRLKGRTDYKGYYDSCDTVLNMVIQPQGGATRRPGTLFSALTKRQDRSQHLIPFQFSVVQAYMLEFGVGYIRVFKDRSPVTNEQTVTGAINNGAGRVRLTIGSTTGMADGNTAIVADVGGVASATGTWVIDVISATEIDLVDSIFFGTYTSGGTVAVIVEIPTGYTSNDLQSLAFTQSTDTLYIFSPDHPAATLTRSSHTQWTLADVVWQDGPYLPVNTTATTLTASAASGSVTMTLSATTGVNDDQGWLTTDVGRLIRFKNTNWGWALITAWTSSTVVTALMEGDVNNGAVSGVDITAGTTNWRLGKWSETTGYPWEPTFWQQRLMACGTDNQPNAIEGSQTGDFTNMAPTKADGSVIDTNAISWIISDDQVNAIRWVSAAGSAQAVQLGIGTDGSEHILQAATTSAALTPTSVQAYRETTLGSKAYAAAIRIGKAVLMTDGRKIYEWQFDWQVNGYRGPDLTVDSEHITRSIVIDTCYQKRPNGVLWMVTETGQLLGFTYLPEQSIKAFHGHVLGGDYYGGPPVVESIACIPSTDNDYDELWLAVKRTVNGAVMRTIEVMDRYFDGQPQEEAVFLDCALESALTEPSGTIAADSLEVIDAAGAPVDVIFTVTGATPFSSGSVGSIIRMAGGVAEITAFTDTTHVTGQWFTAPPNLAPVASGSWTMTAQHASFSGVDHLVGEEVGILGDGADFGEAVVDADGGVALTNGSASYATIGLPATYRLVTMPWEPQRAAAASSQGKIKTIAHMYVRYLESLGFDYGRRVTDPMTTAVEDKLETLTTRTAGDLLGRAPPLQTGIVRLGPQGSHDQEGQMIIEGSGPLPCTILSIFATGDVGEMQG